MNVKHPLYIAADQVKTALSGIGFEIIDMLEYPYVLDAKSCPAVWEEPEGVKCLNDDPIALNRGKTILRSRLMSRELSLRKIRAAACGFVFLKDDEELPAHYYVEGLVRDTEGTAKLLELQDNTYGEAMTTGALQDGTGMGFLIDIDLLAGKLFGIADRRELYHADLSRLTGFRDGPSFGTSYVQRFRECMRSLGYCEMAEKDFVYPGIYRKTNMVRDAWDLNNYGYMLTEPVGKLDQLRTVQTPFLEDAMAENLHNGTAAGRLFEIGHVYNIAKEGYMPDEHLFLIIGVYGEGLTFEAFGRDVSALLQAVGIRDFVFGPISLASAYKPDECSLILSKTGKYLGGNLGQIHPNALKNYGISCPAFMANFDIGTMYRNKSE